MVCRLLHSRAGNTVCILNPLTNYHTHQTSSQEISTHQSFTLSALSGILKVFCKKHHIRPPQAYFHFHFGELEGQLKSKISRLLFCPSFFCTHISFRTTEVIFHQDFLPDQRVCTLCRVLLKSPFIEAYQKQSLVVRRQMSDKLAHCILRVLPCSVYVLLNSRRRRIVVDHQIIWLFVCSLLSLASINSQFARQFSATYAAFSTPPSLPQSSIYPRSKDDNGNFHPSALFF